MPTNEERREAAERLRNYENLRESFKESPICAFINALGFGGYLDWKGVCSRLADLIEPEPERTFLYVKNKDGEMVCSKCGAEEPGIIGDAHYCYGCGAKVVEE